MIGFDTDMEVLGARRLYLPGLTIATPCAKSYLTCPSVLSVAVGGNGIISHRVFCIFTD